MQKNDLAKKAAVQESDLYRTNLIQNNDLLRVNRNYQEFKELKGGEVQKNFA